MPRHPELLENISKRRNFIDFVDRRPRFLIRIDEELVALTTYQQAYTANARMIQATKDLFDVLDSLIT